MYILWILSQICWLWCKGCSVSY